MNQEQIAGLLNMNIYGTITSFYIYRYSVLLTYNNQMHFKIKNMILKNIPFDLCTSLSR
jgi:hypothetical protein